MGIKYAVNESFFEEWNSEMAYVVGYWYADGSLENAPYIRAKYIRVTSTDRETIEYFKRVLSAEHPVTLLKKYGNQKDRFQLRIGNHRIYESLVAVGLYPNKSLTMTFPDVPAAHLADFVRGYFDGDGWVGIEYQTLRTGEQSVKRLGIAFTSGSKTFLEGLSSELHMVVGTSHLHAYRSRSSFQLRYSTADSLKLFKFMYRAPRAVYLVRKFRVFKKYFAQRPERVDAIVHNILQRPSGEAG